MSTKSNKSFDPLLVLLGVVILATLLAFAIRRGAAPPARERSMPVDQPAPPIAAAGWLNGPAPTAESLAGKVVVIDAWASWCGPCRAAAPEMVASYNRFRDQGVVFIGLSGEDAESLDDMKEFISSGKITWVNGYGARTTLSALRVEYIPAVFVIDRKGQIIWNSDEAGTLDEAISRALANQG